MQTYELYCAGYFENGIGSCAWYGIDIMSKDLENCKGVMSGPTRAIERMRLRSIFEGLLGIPEGSRVRVSLECIVPDDPEDTDISSAIKQVISDRRLTVEWVLVQPVNSEDLPIFPGELLYVVTCWAQRAVETFKPE